MQCGCCVTGIKTTGMLVHAGIVRRPKFRPSLYGNVEHFEADRSRRNLYIDFVAFLFAEQRLRDGRAYR